MIIAAFCVAVAALLVSTVSTIYFKQQAGAARSAAADARRSADAAERMAGIEGDRRADEVALRDRETERLSHARLRLDFRSGTTPFVVLSNEGPSRAVVEAIYSLAPTEAGDMWSPINITSPLNIEPRGSEEFAIVLYGNSAITMRYEVTWTDDAGPHIDEMMVSRG